MSYVAVSPDSDEKFTLKEAVDVLGAELIGSELIEKYGGWPMYSKFFDFQNPLFHHVHLMFEHAANVGKLGKPESYYFPPQLNNNTGEMNATYFGFDPDIDPEEVKERLRDYNKGRHPHHRAVPRLPRDAGYRLVYPPPASSTRPASVLTYEPQWNSDVNSVQENVVSGEIYPRRMLVEECPPDKQDDIDYIFSLLDWEKNTDPHYRKHYYRPPVVASESEAHVEKWVSYANEFFGAKELTVYPGQSVVIRDGCAYGCIFVQGHGKFGGFDAEAPVMLRYGKQSADEYFVSEPAARRGIRITNESRYDDLVLLKHFGPNHPDMPKTVV